MQRKWKSALLACALSIGGAAMANSAPFPPEWESAPPPGKDFDYWMLIRRMQEK
jgi:hypothetical protein